MEQIEGRLPEEVPMLHTFKIWPDRETQLSLHFQYTWTAVLIHR